MAKRLTKKTMFLLSLVIFGVFGLIQNIILDNFSKSRSSFKKEDVSSLPRFIETARADIVASAAGCDGSDGCGDGSNGF